VGHSTTTCDKLQRSCKQNQPTLPVAHALASPRYLFADEDSEGSPPTERPSSELPDGVREQLGEAGVCDDTASSQDPQDRDGTDGLFEAVTSGDSVVVSKLLVADPAAVNRRDAETGATPLMLACDRDHAGVVAALLAAPGIEVNAADADGLTALHYAVIIGSAGLARTLLAAGADPSKCDVDGESPISMAREDGKDELVAILEDCARGVGVM
jgi:hypothetical protein